MITTGIKTEFQALTNAIIAPAIITSLIAGRKTRKYVLISLAPSIRLALINSDEKLSELCPNKYTKNGTERDARITPVYVFNKCNYL